MWSQERNNMVENRTSETEGAVKNNNWGFVPYIAKKKIGATY
jgi:hypothetical protein